MSNTDDVTKVIPQSHKGRSRIEPVNVNPYSKLEIRVRVDKKDGNR
jgi:hypothetical protein